MVSKLFDGTDDDFEQALDIASRRLSAQIDAAADCDGTWSERIGEIISALAEAVRSEPELSVLCLVHAGARDGRRGPVDPALLEVLIAALRPRPEDGSRPRLPPRTEEFLAGGVLTVIGQRLERGEADSLPAVAAELTELVRLSAGPAPR